MCSPQTMCDSTISVIADYHFCFSLFFSVINIYGEFEFFLCRSSSLGWIENEWTYFVDNFGCFLNFDKRNEENVFFFYTEQKGNEKRSNDRVFKNGEKRLFFLNSKSSH